MLKKIFSVEDEYRHVLINILGLQIRISRFGYFKKKIIPDRLNNIPVLQDIEGNNTIYEALISEKPCLITKFGSVELNTVSCYIDYKKNNGFCKFPKKIIRDMIYQTGFFSADNEQVLRFCKDVLGIINNTDIMGVYAYKHKKEPSEENILKNTKNKAIKLVPLAVLGEELLKINHPWTRALKGKKVLVIHPFIDSIKKQYSKREFLFANKDILPEFDLITLKAVQGIDTENAKMLYGDWYNALEYMYKQIDETDFDIALIGAGSFGMFLANYIKAKGKKAVHMGGALQILFGILGKRWEDYSWFNEMINEYWSRPAANERVKDLSEFLKGERHEAYW